MTTTSSLKIPIIPITSPPSARVIAQIVSLHQECILHDSSLMRFHPPFDATKTQAMVDWWTSRLADVGTPVHHVFLAISAPTSATSAILTQGASSAEPQVVGIAELLTPKTDTGQCVSSTPSSS
jgi:hypothetical protein